MSTFLYEGLHYSQAQKEKIGLVKTSVDDGSECCEWKRSFEMSAYEELVERIRPLVWDYDGEYAERVIAEVLRTLKLWTGSREFEAAAFHTDCSAGEMNTLLDASPISPK